MASRRGPDNSVRLAISGSMRSVNWANIFHLQLTTGSAITQADLDTWTAQIALYYENRFKAVYGSDVTTSSAKAVLYTPGGGELISVSARSQAGTGGSPSMMGAPCAVVSWLSGVYWRGGKPRTYIPGIPAGNIQSGNDLLTNALVTALKTDAAGFLTDCNAYTVGTITNTKLGFVSFRTGGTERVPPVFYPFTGSTVHPRVGTQRRRDGHWVT